MSWILKTAFVIAVALGTVPVGVVASPPSAADATHPAPAREFACGQPGKPCPLQAWMRSTLASATTRGDAEALAKGFDYLAANPPPAYGDWAKIAKEGAALARKKDVEGAKLSCQTCHSKYKSKYKEEIRDRPL